MIGIYILIGGIWGLLIKVASTLLNSYTVAFIASSCTWLTIAIISYSKLNFKSHIGVFVAAVCGFLGGIVLLIFYSALEVAPANRIIPLSTLYVLVTVILSYFFIGETITLKQITGIILGFASIVLLTAK